MLSKGLGLRDSLAFTVAGVIAYHRIAVGKSGISQRIIRVSIGCLLKLLHRFVNDLGSAFIPEVTAFKIELIGGRIGGESLG